MKKIASLFITLVLLIPCSLFAIVRGALDVGSGTIKLTVADVDTSHETILKIFYENEYSLPLRADMAVSGKDYFSEKIQAQALETVLRIQHEMEEYNVEEWSGIATAASRQSKNAQELYDRIYQESGIPIQIISQKEEGKIGFVTASSVAKWPQSDLIAYDSGGGSFQLTTQIDGCLEVTFGNFAMVTTWSTLVQEIRKEKIDPAISPNPVSKEEAKTLIALLKQKLPTLSPAFSQKLHNKNTKVVGFGGHTSIFTAGALATGKKTYTKEELLDAIFAHCDLPNEKLPPKFTTPDEFMLGMILLYSVMDGLNIESITYCYSNGNCEGLLIDPTYWSHCY